MSKLQTHETLSPGTIGSNRGIWYVSQYFRNRLRAWGLSGLFWSGFIIISQIIDVMSV